MVVDFFSPSCYGCRMLYPKLRQIAANNLDVAFIKVDLSVCLAALRTQRSALPLAEICAASISSLPADLHVSPAGPIDGCLICRKASASKPRWPDRPLICPPLQVNTESEEMQNLAAELGVTGLPFFNLHAGAKVEAFAANLSKVLSLHQLHCWCSIPPEGACASFAAGFTTFTQALDRKCG